MRVCQQCGRQLSEGLIVAWAHSSGPCKIPMHPPLARSYRAEKDSFKLKSVMADRLMTKGQAPVRHEGARLLPDPVHGISTAIEAREAPAFNKAAR
jgi:hypothetical protein